MSPHDHIAEGGDEDGGGGEPAQELPQPVRVVELAVGQLPAHLTPHQARAVCNTDTCHHVTTVRVQMLPMRAPYRRGEGKKAKSDSAKIRTMILADLS